MSTMPTIPQPMMYQSHPTPNPKGSFGPVFIVLSVISALALIACLLSRFCSRKISRSKLDVLDHVYDSESDLEKGEKGFGIDFNMVKPNNTEVSQNRKGDFEIKFPTVKSNMNKDHRGVMRSYAGNNVIHPDVKNNNMRSYGGNNVIHPDVKNNVRNYGGNNVIHPDVKNNNVRNYGGDNVIHPDLKNNNGVYHPDIEGRRLQGKHMNMM